MTLEEIVALGAFAPERVKAEQRLIAEDTDNISACISWAHRRQHYIDQLGYVPSPSDIVSAVVRTVGGKPFFGGKQIRISNISVVARDLGTVTKTSADAYFDALSDLVTPRQASSDTGLSARYYAMLGQGYNDVDATLYSRLRWTITEGHTESTILVPVGHGSEYLPIPMDADDLYDALPRLAAPEGTNCDSMLEYVDTVHRRMVNACMCELDDAAALDGVPATALDTMLSLIPVREDKVIIGYKIGYKGGKYPDVKDWLRASLRKWVSYVPMSPIPEPISNDPTVPTYCYRDLSIYRPGEFPTIRAWMESVSYEGEFEYNLKTLAMYAYISNVADNECKQVIWIHGAGTDAKSPVVRALTADFGHHAGALDLSSGSDHATTQIVGKVMLTVADSKNPNTLRDKMVQKITGRDLVHINPKGSAMYSITSVAKMIVTENIFPQLTCHDQGQVSRLLLIDLRSRSRAELISMGLMHVDDEGQASFSGDKTFRPRVQAEANAFIHYGKLCWEALGCPNNLPVPRNIREKIEDICSPPEDIRMYRDIRSWTTLAPGKHILREDIHDMLDHYYPPRIPDASRPTKVLDLIYDGQVVITQVRIGPGRRPRVYDGVAFTPAGQKALDAMVQERENRKTGDRDVLRLPSIDTASTHRPLTPRGR